LEHDMMKRSSRARNVEGRSGLLTAAPLVAALSLAASASAHSASPFTVEATSSSMIWTGVVHDGGKLIVAGPRWSGSSGPAVARVVDGGLVEYPDAAWNGWSEGSDAAGRFVNVNAIHEDGRGSVYAVDTGSPTFGGDPLPGGAKVVRIDLATDTVSRVFALAADIAKPGSYVDDIRFHGDVAYLTDAGNPGIIVLDLITGNARRVLEGNASVTAAEDRPIVVDGAILRGPDGKPLRVHSDPMEISPDGEWLYYGPLEGKWSRIPTRMLDDPAVDSRTLAGRVEPWADLPPMGGSTMDARGNLYFSDLAHDAILRRARDGSITTVVQDERLHWVDAIFLDKEGFLWLPAAQLDRAPLFHGGRSQVRWPVSLYRIPVPTGD
jgi:hypothetical protein